jgi:hypothetical protein
MLRIPKGIKNATIEGEMQLNTREAGGRFLRNLARTTPLLPWGRATLPQVHR